jgi:hypothetical protein
MLTDETVMAVTPTSRNHSATAAEIHLVLPGFCSHCMNISSEVIAVKKQSRLFDIKHSKMTLSLQI